MSAKKSKQFQCTYCEKLFNLQSQLIIHIRQHTGEKPFECEHCKKGFASLKVLKVHERIHTGEKPYKCPYCEKCFSAYANLVVHKRIHTNEKPYQCKLCKRAFEHSGNLSRHAKAHMTDFGFRCILCTRIFEKDFELLQHTKIDHKNEYMSYIMKDSRYLFRNNPTSSGINEDLTEKSVPDDESVPQSDRDESCAYGYSQHLTNFNVCSQEEKTNVSEYSKIKWENHHEFINYSVENPTHASEGPVYFNQSPPNTFPSQCNHNLETDIQTNSSTIHENYLALSTEPDVATACHQLKSTLNISKNKSEDKSETYSGINLPIEVKANLNFSSFPIGEELSHAYSDPPPLIPIEEVEEAEESSKPDDSLVSMQGMSFNKDQNSYCSNVKMDHDDHGNMPHGYSFPAGACESHLFGHNTTDQSCYSHHMIGEPIDSSSMTNFLMSEYKTFAFRRKVEKVLAVLLGKEKLQRFGYPEKNCEQVLISILDSINQPSCSDVRVDETERFKINVRLLIERSFPDESLWQDLGWKGKSTEFILDQIIQQNHRYCFS